MKWEYIREISKASGHYGEKLLELMDETGAYNLRQVTEAQARDYYLRMIRKEGTHGTTTNTRQHKGPR